MGCGDWRFRFFGTLATFLCHNPLPIPNIHFSVSRKKFSRQKITQKNFVNFIHFGPKLYLSGTFRRGRIWGWYCIFGILGAIFTWCTPAVPISYFSLEPGGTKMPFFGKKSHSFLESWFKFERFEPHRSYIWCGFDRCSQKMKIEHPLPYCYRDRFGGK